MTIHELCDKLKKDLEQRYGIVAYRSNLDNIAASHSEVIAHALWMLDEIPKYYDMDKLEKANRWLGFVQGALWATGSYSIEMMRKQNSNLT